MSDAMDFAKVLYVPASRGATRNVVKNPDKPAGQKQISSRLCAAGRACWQMTKKSPELSDRELATLLLLSHGLSVPDIAARCGLSVATVRTIVRRVQKKLGAKTQTEAAAIAARRALI